MWMRRCDIDVEMCGRYKCDEERAMTLDLVNGFHRIPLHKLRFLQANVSAKFKDGSSLEECVCQIDSGELDPSARPNFALNLARPGRSDLYCTLDHRRLLAMQIVGCEMDCCASLATSLSVEGPRSRFTPRGALADSEVRSVCIAAHQ